MAAPRLELSGFGTRAAEGANIQELLQQASEEIAAGLGVSHVKILEYLPEDKILLVKAGVGWSEGVLGNERLGVDMNSPAGFALQTGQAVVSNKLAEEERFRIPPLLERHGVKSATNVIIKAGEFIYGVLEADSREPRRFSEEDSQYLQGYANILALALRQAELTQKNFELSEYLERLLHELAHRTKNNNQILSSLVQLQKQNAVSLEAKENLDIINSRIYVLNELDNLILSARSLTNLDLGKYLIAIVNKILSIDAENARKLKLKTDIVEKHVDSKIAQPVAMIVNEFLTNSFKYAFPQGADTISMSLHNSDRGTVISVADNGPGFQRTGTQGLGFRLMEAMAAQIGAELSWATENGTKLTITMQLP